MARPGELKFEEILIAREVFARHAESKIRSVHQLRSALSDLGQYPSQLELDTVLETFGGAVKFDQFSRYLEFLKRVFLKPEAKDADTVRAFVALGGNKDRGGNIVADDLRSACRNFNLTIDIETLLNELDTDRSGNIDYAEFRSIVDDRPRGENGEPEESSHMEGNGVSFQIDEEAQSEAEYVAMLRAFLTAEKKDPETSAQLTRTGSQVRRKQSRGNIAEQSMRKSTRTLPPIALQTSPSKSTAAAEPAAVDDEYDAANDDVKPAETTRTATVSAHDLANRRATIQPIIVGRRGRPTPRNPSSLPSINTPRSARTSSKTPRKNASSKTASSISVAASADPAATS